MSTTEHKSVSEAQSELHTWQKMLINNIQFYSLRDIKKYFIEVVKHFF